MHKPEDLLELASKMKNKLTAVAMSINCDEKTIQSLNIFEAKYATKLATKRKVVQTDLLS